MNIYSRRSFLDRSFKIGMGVALSTLTDIPLVMKQALAEGNIGLNGKKLLFIFLRGANDSLNSVIPIQDSAYATSRPTIQLTKGAGYNYASTGACFDPTQMFDLGGTTRAASDPTFSFPNAIPTGNGFAALHPSLKFLAPIYNAGDLAVIHRVGYPKQSRSHFDSQNYWENANPNNNIVKDGIFYRTMIESGLANTAPLTGVSIQSALPLSLRGSAAAMTNLTDPTRYNLLGIPNGTGDNKADAAVRAANGFEFPNKLNRDLLNLQYGNLSNTLQIFAGLDFSDAGNTFVDDINTDNDRPYNLFPTSNAKNGGYNRVGGATDPNKYVVPTSSYGFFGQLKAAALILNNTDALIAGTEMGGFDTHQTQGADTGSHANLQRQIAYAIYGLRKYFLKYSNKATWDNMVIVTMSEFGRTTVENSDRGTDHAEAGVMFVAGGGVKGYGKGNTTGVFGCNTTDSVIWTPGPTGTMFGANSRYLKRAVDYRSVMGKLIRDHMGATQNQLNRIIPGYTVAGEKLASGGTSTIDNTSIMGELPIV